MSQPSDGTPRPTTTEPPAPNRDEDGKKKKKKKKKHGAGHITSSFIGKCDEIKQHVYDVSPGNGFDTFAKTTREIGEHIARTVKNAGEFRTAMDPEKFGFAKLVVPADPIDPTNVMEVKKWEVSFKKYNDAVEQRAKATSQAFAIILGQCSPTVVDRLKANDMWTSVRTSRGCQGFEIIRQ